MPSYFPEISSDPDMNEWQEKLAYDPTERSEQEGGYEITWGKFTRVPREINVMLKQMSDSDKQKIQRFERYTINVGAESFYMKNFQEAYGVDAWIKKTVYVLHQVVRPVVATGRSYICTVPGTSKDGAEPTWPTSFGGTVADEGITWKENSMQVRLTGLIQYVPMFNLPTFWQVTFGIREV
jgi:hypothetical protein